MRTRVLILVAIVILAIPLALLLRDFVRDVFLVELGRAIWVARIVLESLPQGLLWAGLVVALVALALRVFRPGGRSLPHEAHGSAEPLGRVQVLSRWIDRGAKSEYFRQSLVHHLAGLTWEVMAYGEHASPDRLKQRLRAGELDLPPLVEEVLRSGRAAVVPPSTGFFSRLWQRLAIGKRGTWRPEPGLGPEPGPRPGPGLRPGPEPDPALEPLIEFLEAQLGIRAEGS